MPLDNQVSVRALGHVDAVGIGATSCFLTRQTPQALVPGDASGQRARDRACAGLDRCCGTNQIKSSAKSRSGLPPRHLLAFGPRPAAEPVGRAPGRGCGGSTDRGREGSESNLAGGRRRNTRSPVRYATSAIAPAPPRLGPRWGRERRWATGFLGCERMRSLPPLVHQDVGGYEEVFEVHAEHRLPFGELSRRQWRASG